MPNFGQNPFFILILLGILFIPLERKFFSYGDWRAFRPQFWTDVAYHFSTWGIVFFEFTVVSKELVMPMPFHSSAQFFAEVPFWMITLLVVFITTFMDYWGHRLLHTPRFWPLHVIHHSSKQVDWLAATRVHPLELIFLRGSQALPLWLLGFPKEAYVVNLLIWFLYGDFTHANLRFSLGPLKNWMVNPSYHHWHHSKIREREGDTNFGGFLTIWDRAFGTFHPADGNKPLELGVETDLPAGYFHQLIYPLKIWLSRAK